MSRKICKNCKLFVDKNVSTCPSCKGHQFGENFKGRIFILEPGKSEVAKKMEITYPGEYAIKVS